MSLIHDALNKARTEGKPKQGNPGPKVRSFATRQRAVRPLALLVFAIGAGILAIFAVSDRLPRFRVNPAVPPNPTGIQAQNAEAIANQEPPLSAVEPSSPTAPEISAHLSKGAELYKQGDLGGAEAEFLRALTLDSSSAMAQNYLGLVMKTKGDLDAAERRYLEAIRLDPNNAQAMNNLGVLYDQQNRIDDAARLYAGAIDQDSRYAEVRLNYAILLERVGYFPDAKKQYEAYLLLAPSTSSTADLVRRRLSNLP